MSVNLPCTTTHPEQQKRRQKMLDAARKVLLLLGHTHAPAGLMFQQPAKENTDRAGDAIRQPQQLWEGLVKAMGELLSEAEKEVSTNRANFSWQMDRSKVAREDAKGCNSTLELSAIEGDCDFIHKQFRGDAGVFKYLPGCSCSVDTYVWYGLWQNSCMHFCFVLKAVL